MNDAKRPPFSLQNRERKGWGTRRLLVPAIRQKRANGWGTRLTGKRPRDNLARAMSRQITRFATAAMWLFAISVAIGAARYFLNPVPLLVRPAALALARH